MPESPMGRTVYLSLRGVQFKSEEGIIECFSAHLLRAPERSPQGCIVKTTPHFSFALSDLSY